MSRTRTLNRLSVQPARNESRAKKRDTTSPPVAPLPPASRMDPAASCVRSWLDDRAAQVDRLESAYRLLGALLTGKGRTPSALPPIGNGDHVRGTDNLSYDSLIAALTSCSVSDASKARPYLKTVRDSIRASRA